ncbi:MAG: hypothetical protein AB9846_00940 [Tenuifilaceae bacterium]
MEKERLIERLNFTMMKKDVLALAEMFKELDGGVAILFDLCQSKNETLSFHAAWVLENVLTSNRDLFSLSIPKIIELLPTIKSSSLQRHFCKLLKIAMDLCNSNDLPKDACNLFKKLDMEPVVESCFEWLMDPLAKPAVKAHCMDILFYLSKRYDWITDELPHVIKLQMIDTTPGIRNKGEKVLGILRKR